MFLGPFKSKGSLWTFDSKSSKKIVLKKRSLSQSPPSRQKSEHKTPSKKTKPTPPPMPAPPRDPRPKKQQSQKTSQTTIKFVTKAGNFRMYLQSSPTLENICELAKSLNEYANLGASNFHIG